MLRSFVVWLDDHLAGEGSTAIVRGIVGLLSFAALLGALLGSVAVKAGVVVAVLLTLLSLALLLLADRRSLHGQLNLHKRLVSRYSKQVDELSPRYQVLSWEQVAHVANSSGDTKEVVTIRARVLRPDMWVVRLVFSCGWSQPARYRRGVTVNVRNLLVTDVLGTSPDVTFSWVADGKIDAMIHFSTPPVVGSEVRFIVLLDWPRKCAPLMNGITDQFSFTFFQQQVEKVSYKIVLPAGQEAYWEPVGFESGDPNFSVDVAVGDDGRGQYFFQGLNLPVRHTAGIKLQLKSAKRGAHQWPVASAQR
ncbi:hypothetical protein JOF56_003576 [Kibdelosporangium banguiense]|uniref:Uncharacterized protein n=1 Tax=Kibdelosporangium banguiense TaxID=1365924 RepID=A0ABS4TFJ9_9PSEU|nr:hypothetical protein [Kibdelosporangium banguiense]MBP2323191.1 hypothetical protein [Kibdelosporangium banguiense]